MRRVIDCSTAVKWEVNEPDSDEALLLRNNCRNGTLELLVPDIFPIEVANALFGAELRGSIPVGQFANRLANVLKVGPVLYQSTALLPRAVLIIRKAAARIGIYDCLYVALAEREGCELVTSDKKLINAPGAAYPFIVPLSSIR